MLPRPARPSTRKTALLDRLTRPRVSRCRLARHRDRRDVNIGIEAVTCPVSIGLRHARLGQLALVLLERWPCAVNPALLWRVLRSRLYGIVVCRLVSTLMPPQWIA